MPAGNCKLQTLRQYYGLPERGAHTALGDVLTVVDLMAQVIRPIAEERGLDTWEKVAAFASEEWYPSRIAFGKHKGRCVWDARSDAELRGWLEWLAQSSNPRSASMGRWYLQRLGQDVRDAGGLFAWGLRDAPSAAVEVESTSGLVLYVNPELHRLTLLVEAARARLAGLEAAFTTEKAKVDALQATLFRRLREHYLKRDRLRLVVGYRRKFLESLLAHGEDEAEQVRGEFRQAEAQNERDYEEAASAMAAKKELSPAEAEEVGRLWRKVVKLDHPDRFASEPQKLETYHKLSSAINEARDAGDLATLREIANNPDGFLLRRGWVRLGTVAELHRLWQSLELEIVRVLEATNQLHESPKWELCELIAKDSALIDSVAAKQTAAIEEEIRKLESEAEQLAAEIAELTGSGAAVL